MKNFSLRLFIYVLLAVTTAYAADVTPWTRNLSAPFTPSQGLAGRHICVWASHGRYFNVNGHPTTPRDSLRIGAWQWQRPNLFCTTEDLLTPSFVYPFLIPMLENAGAVVWTPRERDMQTHMTIVPQPTRQTARHYEWQATVDTLGAYAVYVRYPALPDAVPDATYTIHHGGERTRIAVNQRMGADTWVYLGTYHFNPAIPRDGLIRLSTATNYRGRLAVGSVRLGGGMGHIVRQAPQKKGTTPADAVTSGLPHYLEAARYWTEWAGLPDSLCNTEHGLGDYNDDLRSRSNMLNLLMEQRGVPFELSLGVHTDAGYRTDSIYGSLAIYTSPNSIPRRAAQGDSILYCDGGVPGGELLCRHLYDGIVRDLADLDWQHRGLRDGNYSETRAPHVPAAIIEMLSHQNFLDMRYAHDPIFKFRLARAIYKAILHYSQQDHCPTIQPLPVHSFSAILHGDEAHLSWKATPDTLEPTALPTHYIIYTRLDDGDFDNGQLTDDTHFHQPVTPGHRYTFRIVAANDGGLSFPSEQLTVYKAPNEPTAQNALLVSAFTRLSGPAFISTPDSLGFLLNEDPGVPYGTTLEYCGPQLDFSPLKAGKEGPGALGYSSSEWEGRPLTGNTFDIVPRRAALLVQADSLTSFSSACADALPWAAPADPPSPIHTIYYLAGQQRRAPHNMADFPVWPHNVRPYIVQSLEAGCPLIVEGTYTSPEHLSPEEREWWKILTEKKDKYHIKNINDAAPIGKPASFNTTPHI